MRQTRLHANIQTRKQDFARNEANKIAHNEANNIARKDTIGLRTMKQTILHAKTQ